MGSVGNSQQPNSNNKEKHRCHALAFLFANLLATEPATNCGSETRPMAMMESGHSDNEPPPNAIATHWPTAMLSVQRQALIGNR
jgi:hypothetical protein